MISNRRFSDVFRGYRIATLVENGLMIQTLIRDRLQISPLHIQRI